MNAAVDIFIGLAHLVEWILKAHNARSVRRNEALGNLEYVSVKPVEAPRDVAGYFNMLLLVGADRHLVSLIEQDVARHKHGIGEQTCVDVVCVLGALVLELRHPRKLAELGVAVQYPSDFGVGVDVALNKEYALFNVDPAGEDRGVCL